MTSRRAKKPPRRKTTKAPPSIDSAPRAAGAVANAKPAPFPKTLKPQLAVTGAAIPAGPKWIHELKFDGYRLMCFVRDGSVRLITRGGHDWTNKFPAIAKALARVPVSSAVFDGEAIAIDKSGTPSFHALQNAIGSSGITPSQLCLFDLPYCNGFDLRRTPLIERKQVLQTLLNHTPASVAADVGGTLIYSAHFTQGRELFKQAGQRGFEGTISKLADSEYVSGRSSAWVKNKCTRRQEFVVCGYLAPKGTRVGFGSLILGYNDPAQGGLVYCGNVGTGFSDQTLIAIKARLKPIERARTPFVSLPKGISWRGSHWVEPKLVAEVQFQEWTPDGRLRHPSFIGLREDKKATEVVRERPVAL